MQRDNRASLRLAGAWALVALFALGGQIILPQIVDEQYFVSWGLHPALGYYDHPPLLGWFSVVFIKIEDLLGISPHGLVHRLAWLLGGVGTGIWLARYMARRFPAQDRGATLLAFAALPATMILFGIYYNDTLLGWMVLAFVVATDSGLRADSRRARWGYALLAGLAFGAALETKYVAGLFWVAMVLHLALLGPKGWRYVFGPFLLSSAVAAVLLAPNLWWNLYNCNVNLAFNFAYRQMAPGLRGAGLFVVQMLVVLGPVAWGLWRARAQAWRGGYGRYFLILLALSALISVSRGTWRMNWGFSYLPLAALAAAEAFTQGQMRRTARAALVWLVLGFSPLLALFAADKAGLDPAAWIAPPSDLTMVRIDLDLANGPLITALEPYAQAGRVVAMVTYGQGAQAQNAGFESVVFPIRENLAVFGRNFDLCTDYAALEGRDFGLLGDEPARARALAQKVFAQVREVEVVANHQRYTAFLGDGFGFEAYRQAMILPAIARFYDRYPFGA
ncbi:MAG TPA: hypothetical protein ENK83_04190, partial [Aliiroseovarius sp.]|nr:hypothetical protein [Aliiroseovarius sp.]